MKTTAIILRAAQLTAHNAHNMARGATFFEDHEFFGELYPAYEAEYDAVVERMLGLEQEVDLIAINRQAVDISSANKPADDSGWLSALLAMEKRICAVAEQDARDASFGSNNFLQGIADSAEKRIYQFVRRRK